MSSVPSRSIPIQPSARKLAAQHRLSQLAVKLSDGSDYQLQDALLPEVTLTQVRDALKNIPEPLALAVIQERQQP